LSVPYIWYKLGCHRPIEKWILFGKILLQSPLYFAFYSMDLSEKPQLELTAHALKLVHVCCDRSIKKCILFGRNLLKTPVYLAFYSVYLNETT
jgi:hypothetical protein